MMISTMLMILCMVAVAVVLVTRIEKLINQVDDLSMRIDSMINPPVPHDTIYLGDALGVSQEQIEEAYKRAGL